MEQERKYPWFLDFHTHRFKLAFTLPFSSLYAVLSLMAFGVTPVSVACAIAVIAIPIGSFYLAEYVVNKALDE